VAFQARVGGGVGVGVGSGVDVGSGVGSSLGPALWDSVAPAVGDPVGVAEALHAARATIDRDDRRAFVNWCAFTAFGAA